MAEATPRTLADQLRSWSDAELARLLSARPDLAEPAPQDSSQLASRAGTRASVLRAVDGLNVLELAVLDALVGLGRPASLADVQARVNASADSAASAVERLRELALLWGPTDELRPLSAVAEVVSTTVSGLGPPLETLLAGYGPERVIELASGLGLDPSGERQSDIQAIAAHLADPGSLEVLVADLDVRARAVLDHLEREGLEGTRDRRQTPKGSKARRGPKSDDGNEAAVDQLLARGLLVARDPTHLAVPREVALGLRGGVTTRDRVDELPALSTDRRDTGLVDRAGAGAAFELVRHVELLLEHWGTSPPSALRTGGLGVRDLRAAGELLHLDDARTALHVEIASAAGLLALGRTDDAATAWLPTDAFDAWSAVPVAERWVRLAVAWLLNPRLTGLVGTRENGKPVNALAPGLERGWLPAARRAALEQLATLPPGEVLAAGTGAASLVERLKWLRPRRPALRGDAVAWVLEEAAVLGLVALGGLSSHGRALVSDSDPSHAATTALEPLLPDPVDHILLQADLTAVAPGPLEHDLAHSLATMADIESRGGATVYRFSASSVRRAFDSGWSAAEVHEFIASSSRTPVPQPLVYLVDDVARRFGTLRVGAVESFLRSDDEAALAELVHHPKAQSLRLRRIAPTVVVSDVPLDVLLPRLRDLGAAPVAEAPDGTVRLARREAHRARVPKTRPPYRDLAALARPDDPQGAARAAARISSTVTAIRAGDRAAANRPRNADAQLSTSSPVSTLALLRDAVEARQSVWIGYVDSSGSTLERVVDPVRVEGGWLNAYDHRTDEVRSFAIHRIRGVSPASR